MVFIRHDRVLFVHRAGRERSAGAVGELHASVLGFVLPCLARPTLSPMPALRFMAAWKNRLHRDMKTLTQRMTPLRD